MGTENAKKNFDKGKRLLQAHHLGDALMCFSLAIEDDPKYLEAYQYRGYILSKLGRKDEAKADHQKMKSLQEETDPPRDPSPEQSNVISERNTADDEIFDYIDSGNYASTAQGDTDNVYDELMNDEEEDEYDFEDDIYDYAFSDDTLESDDLLDSLISESSEDEADTSVASIIEFVNGMREEVPRTYLFEPSDEEITLVHEPNTEGRVVSLGEIICIRLTRPPADMPANANNNCHVEVIETIGNNIYYEKIPSDQDLTHFLFGYSTKEDTKFKYTLLPLINIRKRFQRRHLGQILVDKQLLSDEDLKTALNEHNELKKIKLGKVLTEQANLLQTAVENEIQKAYRETQGEYKVGQILLNAGLVNEEQVEQALSYQKKMHKRKLGQFLIEKGILQEKDIYMALSEKFRIPYADLRKQKGSKKALSLLPKELIKKLMVLPLSVENDTMVVATLLPDPNPICELILRHSPVKNVEFILVQPSHLKNILRMLF